MMSFPVWLLGPMFLLRQSLSLVPCSFQVGLFPRGSLSRGKVVSYQGGDICRNQKIGRYASYRHTFFFLYFLHLVRGNHYESEKKVPNRNNRIMLNI